MTSAHPKIIVVGAGIIGVSIAYHLAKAGAAPVVVDSTATWAATRGSWAWINASFGNPEPYFRLRMQGIAGWHRIFREIPGLPLSFPGSLSFDLSDADLNSYFAQHRAWGYRMEEAGAARIAELEPALREIPKRAAFCVDEGKVEPVEAADMLLAAAVANGARHLRETVTSLSLAGGRATGVLTTNGRIEADQVVLASGTGTNALLSGTGFTLPLDRPKGILVHSKPLPPVLERLIISPGMEVRQTTAGRIVASIDYQKVRLDAAEATGAAIIARLNAMLRLPEQARLSHVTVTERPIPRDGFSIAGAVPGIAGLTLAVTHSGITLAPAIGSMLAAEILGAARDPLLRPFGPERFSHEAAA